jgi:hypothetical protein
MKVNIFYLCIGFAIALILAYWVFSVAEGDKNDTISGVCSAICFMATLIPLFAIAHKSSRIAVNLRLLAAVFFVLFVICHFCFAAFGVRMPYYVIVNLIALLIFFAIYHWIGKKKYL